MVSHHSAKVAVVYSTYAFESHTLRHNASVAQVVEHLIINQKVLGSNPS